MALRSLMMYHVKSSKTWRMPRAWVTRAMSTMMAEEIVHSKLNAALVSLPALRSHLNYMCDVGKLDQGLQKCFVELSCNQVESALPW